MALKEIYEKYAPTKEATMIKKIGCAGIPRTPEENKYLQNLIITEPTMNKVIKKMLIKYPFRTVSGLIFRIKKEARELVFEDIPYEMKEYSVGTCIKFSDTIKKFIMKLFSNGMPTTDITDEVNLHLKCQEGDNYVMRDIDSIYSLIQREKHNYKVCKVSPLPMMAGEMFQSVRCSTPDKFRLELLEKLISHAVIIKDSIAPEPIIIQYKKQYCNDCYISIDRWISVILKNEGFHKYRGHGKEWIRRERDQVGCWAVEGNDVDRIYVLYKEKFGKERTMNAIYGLLSKHKWLPVMYTKIEERRSKELKEVSPVPVPASSIAKMPETTDRMAEIERASGIRLTKKDIDWNQIPQNKLFELVFNSSNIETLGKLFIRKIMDYNALEKQLNQEKEKNKKLMEAETETLNLNMELQKELEEEKVKNKKWEALYGQLKEIIKEGSKSSKFFEHHESSPKAIRKLAQHFPGISN